MPIWATIVTLLVPGFAHGLVGRYKRMALWAACVLALVAASAWQARCLLLCLLVQLGSAIDGYVCYRRSTTRPGDILSAGSIIAIAIAAVGFGVARLSLVSYRLPSSSGYPTLQIGDHILVDKLSTKLFGVTRGELIAYTYPCDPARTYVSRVIALAGDSVEVRCEVVYVNGTAEPTQLVGSEHYTDVDDFAQRTFTVETTRYHETTGAIAHDVYHQHPRDFPTPGDPPHCDDGTLHAFAAAPDESAQPHCAPHQPYVVPPGQVFVMGDNHGNANDSTVWGGLSITNVVGRVTGVWWPLGRIGNVD